MGIRSSGQYDVIDILESCRVHRQFPLPGPKEPVHRASGVSGRSPAYAAYAAGGDYLHRRKNLLDLIWRVPTKPEGMQTY